MLVSPVPAVLGAGSLVVVVAELSPLAGAGSLTTAGSFILIDP